MNLKKLKPLKPQWRSILDEKLEFFRSASLHITASRSKARCREHTKAYVTKPSRSNLQFIAKRQAHKAAK